MSYNRINSKTDEYRDMSPKDLPVYRQQAEHYPSSIRVSKREGEPGIDPLDVLFKQLGFKMKHPRQACTYRGARRNAAFQRYSK